MAFYTDSRAEPASTQTATQREGRVLVPLDLFIGTHVLSLGAVLLTSNRAFAALAGLPIEDWTQEPG